jgi:hypothetical protein
MDRARRRPKLLAGLFPFDGQSGASGCSVVPLLPFFALLQGSNNSETFWRLLSYPFASAVSILELTDEERMMDVLAQTEASGSAGLSAKPARRKVERWEAPVAGYLFISPWLAGF